MEGKRNKNIGVIDKMLKCQNDKMVLMPRIQSVKIEQKV
jgi:hypothetical protein